MKLYGSIRAWHVHTYSQNHVCEGGLSRRQKLFQSCKMIWLDSWYGSHFKVAGHRKLLGFQVVGKGFFPFPLPHSDAAAFSWRKCFMWVLTKLLSCSEVCFCCKFTVFSHSWIGGCLLISSGVLLDRMVTKHTCAVLRTSLNLAFTDSCGSKNLGASINCSPILYSIDIKVQTLSV